MLVMSIGALTAIIKLFVEAPSDAHFHDFGTILLNIEQVWRVRTGSVVGRMLKAENLF